MNQFGIGVRIAGVDLAPLVVEGGSIDYGRESVLSQPTAPTATLELFTAAGWPQYLDAPQDPARPWSPPNSGGTLTGNGVNAWTSYANHWWFAISDEGGATRPHHLRVTRDPAGVWSEVTLPDPPAGYIWDTLVQDAPLHVIYDSGVYAFVARFYQLPPTAWKAYILHTDDPTGEWTATEFDPTGVYRPAALINVSNLWILTGDKNVAGNQAGFIAVSASITGSWTYHSSLTATGYDPADGDWRITGIVDAGGLYTTIAQCSSGDCGIRTSSGLVSGWTAPTSVPALEDIHDLRYHENGWWTVCSDNDPAVIAYTDDPTGTWSTLTPAETLLDWDGGPPHIHWGDGVWVVIANGMSVFPSLESPAGEYELVAGHGFSGYVSDLAHDDGRWVAAGYSSQEVRVRAAPNVMPHLGDTVWISVTTVTGFAPDHDTQDTYYGAEFRRFTGKVQALDWSWDRLHITASADLEAWARVGIMEPYVSVEENEVTRAATLATETPSPTTLHIEGAGEFTVLPLADTDFPLCLLPALQQLADDTDGLLYCNREGNVTFRSRGWDPPAEYVIPPEIVDRNSLSMTLELGTVENLVVVEYGEVGSGDGVRPTISHTDATSETAYGTRTGYYVTPLSYQPDAYAHAGTIVDNTAPVWRMTDADLIMALATDRQVYDVCALEQGDPVHLETLPAGAPLTDYTANVLGWTEDLSSTSWVVTLHLSTDIPPRAAQVES